MKSPKTVPNTEIWIRKSHIWSLSTNFRLFGGKSQSQQKLAKTITYFITHFRSKNLTYFTKLNSLNVIKIYSRNAAKNMFPICVRRNIYSAPFLDAQELHSQGHLENKCLHIPPNLRLEIFVPET